MTIMTFDKKIACFVRLLDDGYPNSYIEAAAAAFALIMSKLRTPDDMSGYFWQYWIQ